MRASPRAAVGRRGGQAWGSGDNEALIRLVYGRLDPAHTPPVETCRADLDGLWQVFPGF